jgi:hypothetical protein
VTEETVILHSMETEIATLADRVRDLELRAARYDTVIENRIRQVESMWFKGVAIATAIPVLILIGERVLNK